MKKSINEELQDIKFMFSYKPGVVLSEQVEDDEVDFDMMDVEMDEQREVQIQVSNKYENILQSIKPKTIYYYFQRT